MASKISAGDAFFAISINMAICSAIAISSIASQSRHSLLVECKQVIGPTMTNVYLSFAAPFPMFYMIADRSSYCDKDKRP